MNGDAVQDRRCLSQACDSVSAAVGCGTVQTRGKCLGFGLRQAHRCSSQEDDNREARFTSMGDDHATPSWRVRVGQRVRRSRTDADAGGSRGIQRFAFSGHSPIRASPRWAHRPYRYCRRQWARPQMSHLRCHVHVNQRLKPSQSCDSLHFRPQAEWKRCGGSSRQRGEATTAFHCHVVVTKTSCLAVGSNSPPRANHHSRRRA